MDEIRCWPRFAFELGALMLQPQSGTLAQEQSCTVSHSADVCRIPPYALVRFLGFNVYTSTTLLEVKNTMAVGAKFSYLVWVRMPIPKIPRRIVNRHHDSAFGWSIRTPQSCCGASRCSKLLSHHPFAAPKVFNSRIHVAPARHTQPLLLLLSL